jgi:hypothetical protein
LAALQRPIRALTISVPHAASSLLAAHPSLQVRTLPGGKRALHDRVWLVGESGLLLGTSINGFLRAPGQSAGRTTTATELPHADVLAWRTQFEAWW